MGFNSAFKGLIQSSRGPR